MMDKPLCVDLDGTLVKSDLLFETFLLLIKSNPFYLLSCLWWLVRGGKAFLKKQIANRVKLNPALLPYTIAFLDFLKEEKNKGRQLVLATAADDKIARQVADYLGIFSDVIASNGFLNLKGSHKRDRLNQTFGDRQYDYAGNAKEDLAIWEHAHSAILVNPRSSVLRQTKNIRNISAVFQEKTHKLKSIIKLLRVHQYIKNILVFTPIVVGHLFNVTAILHGLLAFVVFCFLASSAYLLNDLLDIEADRQHKTKRKRAFASGELPVSFGLIGFPLCLIVALSLTMFLPINFLVIACTYFLTTILYSFYFKKKMLIDVFVLAMLYTIRIIAGVAAVQADYSPWLISFSLFFFLSLAFVKRYSELEMLSQENKTTAISRGYFVSDLPQLRIFGTASGYISVLILALYINSAKMVILYRSPMFLWIICLLFLYWISRVWMLAGRGDMHDDPVMFALKDFESWIIVALSSFIIIFATI